MNVDVLIAGAGLAGSTAARLLAERGKKVLVVEKRKQVAGNCYDLKNEFGLTWQRYGPHIFHTTQKNVWEFVNRFSSFNAFQHWVLSSIGGKLLPFPINRDTICSIFGIVDQSSGGQYATEREGRQSIEEDVSMFSVRDFLQQEVRKATFRTPPETFRDAVVSQVGDKLYEMFFKNYTIKQWGKPPEDLSPEIAFRIPIRDDNEYRYFTDPYQGIPIGGFTRLVERLLQHENISILLGVDYFEIQKQIKRQLTVYTGFLDLFFDHRYGALHYRKVKFQFETLQQEYFQTAPVINFPNDHDFTRITEFKYLYEEKSHCTALCYEYPGEEGEPCYVVLSKENISKREKYLEEVEKLENTGKYLFVGRLAEFKYYNMDQVIDAVMKKIQEWHG